MKGGWIVGGIILIIVGFFLLLTVLCAGLGILLGIIGFIMIIYGLVASGEPDQQTIIVQQYQPPPYQPQYQPQYPPQYQQPYQPQYLPQNQPHYNMPPPKPAPPPLAEVEWKVCPKCGVENLPEMTFCGRCGEQLVEQVTPPQQKGGGE